MRAFCQRPVDDLGGLGLSTCQERGRPRETIREKAAMAPYLFDGSNRLSRFGYIALPALWKHHEHEPGLADLPMVTRTAAGILGDALNVGPIGNTK